MALNPIAYTENVVRSCLLAKGLDLQEMAKEPKS